ncbi:DUF2254 domain-containing protein [Nakamurella endophytica]|uniref:DUF2254 domain-containing protein n=1 Tax=Nakamurella endophytica TaxID=1748367 RepID=UPI001E2CCC45|nr:DUF2254 family protein [Nakamurella endophytica]
MATAVISRRPTLEHRWRANSLWLVPMACIAAGAVAAAVLLVVDGAVGYDLLPTSVLGTPTAVQTVLSTAASAMLTLTTIVLTVMTLGVQLAMQQFSPRIVRALLADRRSQLAHGLFAATFLFCMVTVAKVDDQADPGHQVPTVTVAAAYLLLLASLVALVRYVHVAGQSLRVAGLIDLVGDNLRAEIDRLFAVEHPVLQDSATVVSGDAGVVVVVDSAALVDAARRGDDCFEMLVRMGDFVPRDAPLLRSRKGTAPDRRLVRRAVLLDNERSHIGDASYGLRKLVDIAERGIASSPYDDPVTAVQAIDRLHDALRQLCVRRLPDGLHHDADGVLRLVTREVAWHGYVAIAFDELVELSKSSPLVARRLLAALDDLVAVAPAERRAPLERQRARLLDRVDDEAIRLVPDVQGLGAGTDVTVDR